MTLLAYARYQGESALEKATRHAAEPDGAQSAPAGSKSLAYQRSVASNLVDALALAGWPWNRRLSLYFNSLEDQE